MLPEGGGHRHHVSRLTGSNRSDADNLSLSGRMCNTPDCVWNPPTFGQYIYAKNSCVLKLKHRVRRHSRGVWKRSVQIKTSGGFESVGPGITSSRLHVSDAHHRPARARPGERRVGCETQKATNLRLLSMSHVSRITHSQLVGAGCVLTTTRSFNSPGGEPEQQPINRFSNGIPSASFTKETSAKLNCKRLQSPPFYSRQQPNCSEMDFSFWLFGFNL